MAHVQIEARRRVTIPYREPNGTLARFTFRPPSEGTFVNEIDDGLLADMKKSKHCQALFDEGVLIELKPDKANDYVDGKGQPQAPEVPPAQAAAEESVQPSESFPKPVEGKGKAKSKS